MRATVLHRISAGNQAYAQVSRYAQPVVEAVPERLLWGTHWSHVMVMKEMPNDAASCELFQARVPDGGVRRKILVQNPQELYGF